MVTKRIRSEYMKKFKDPKWETYTKCYVEMVEYRLSRRLLEHTHNPWIWFGSDSESESGGRSPPPPSNDKLKAGNRSHRAELEECEGTSMTRVMEEKTTRTIQEPRVPFEDKKWQKVSIIEEPPECEDPKVKRDRRKEEKRQRVCNEGNKRNQGWEDTRVPFEDKKWQKVPIIEEPPECEDPKVKRDRRKEEKRQRVCNEGNKRNQENFIQEVKSPQKKTSRSTQKNWNSQQVKPAHTKQYKDNFSGRHPFALYGSGENDASITGKKTHNVLPASSTNAIHASALRAKTRREAERQVNKKKTDGGGDTSANGDKVGKRVQTSFNPWLTEYMCSFADPSYKDSNNRTIHNKSPTSKPAVLLEFKNAKYREWGSC